MSDDKPPKWFNEIVDAVREKCPDDHGYLLVVAPTGEGMKIIRCSSNVERDDFFYLIGKALESRTSNRN